MPEQTSQTSFTRALRTLHRGGVVAMSFFVLQTALALSLAADGQQPLMMALIIGIGVLYLSLILWLISLNRPGGLSAYATPGPVVSLLSRRTAQLEVAASVARDATGQLEPDALLQSTVQLVRERFGYYHVAIFLLDETGQQAQLKALASDAFETLGQNPSLDLPVGGQSVIGSVTHSGRARIVLDAERDPLYLAHPALTATRSELALPLRLGERVLGVMDVQSDQLAAFDQEDASTLQTLADLVAIALNKAQLYGQMRQQAEQEVAERTQALNNERAQLRAILDNMEEGVIYSRGPHIIYLNRAFTQLLGYTQQTWQGLLPIMTHVNGNENDIPTHYWRIRDEVVEQGRWEGEVGLRHADGNILTTHITTVYMPGPPVGAVTVIRDISQEKLLQAQKARFLAYASHELRTPLTNLKTRLYLLERRPDQVRHLTVIRSVVERMQRLVEDLLSHTRMEQGRIDLQRQTVDLHTLLEDVYATQQPEAENKRIRLNLSLTDEPLSAWIDWDRMVQVLTNLLANAINYTSEEGEILLSLRRNGQDQAEIVVRDTGVGIPSDMMEHIFLPFVRGTNTSVQGTGLGLVIARQIVELHAGTIEVESEIGVGSSFIVRLPAIAGAEARVSNGDS